MGPSVKFVLAIKDSISKKKKWGLIFFRKIGHEGGGGPRASCPRMQKIPIFIFEYFPYLDLLLIIQRRSFKMIKTIYTIPLFFTFDHIWPYQVRCLLLSELKWCRPFFQGAADFTLHIAASRSLKKSSPCFCRLCACASLSALLAKLLHKRHTRTFRPNLSKQSVML